MPEEAEFDLTCLECGVPIRKSRVSHSSVGEIAFYIDENGYENVDYHFHEPR